MTGVLAMRLKTSLAFFNPINRMLEEAFSPGAGPESNLLAWIPKYYSII